ncbi:MAG: hypothetical protein RSC49_01590 [Clostridium sp.]
MISNSVISHFEIDLDIYGEIHKKSTRLNSIREEYIENIITYESLSIDLYLALFKACPVMNNKSEIPASSVLNYSIIENLFITDEFDIFRKVCSTNYFNSILGGELLSKYLIKNIIKLKVANKEFNDYIDSFNKNTKLYNKSLDILNKISRFKSVSGSNITSLEDSIESTKNLIEIATENIIKIILSSNILYKVVAAAYKEFLAINSTIKSWGLDDGKMSATSYDDKIEVAIKLRSLKKINKISEMAGRFKASASQIQKRRIREEGQEVYDVKISDELHRVLPSEKMLLANEKTKSAFYKRYYQKELLSYKYKNSNQKSKGPIICCIDTSTSMEGELEVWSKSVAIALLDIAFKQKRDFVGIIFSYKVGQVIEFNKRKIEPKKMYDLATGFIGSGTNFVEPLNESIKLINTARYKYSDIVFITDGEAPLDEEFIEEFLQIKEKKQFRMITVNVSNKIEEGLNKINDIQILLSELTEDNIGETNETIFAI